MLPQNDRKTILYDAFLILLGMVGTLGCFTQTFRLPIDRIYLMSGLCICIAYFFVINSLHKHFHKLSLLSILVYICIVVLNFSTFKNGFIYIINCILRVYEANSQFRFQSFSVLLSSTSTPNIVSSTLLILFVPIVMVVVYTIRQRNSYFLSFLVTMPFLFAILLFTLVPSWTYFIMVLMFYAAMLGMHVASRFDESTSARKLGILFTLSALLVICSIQWIVPKTTYVRSSQVEQVRLQIQSKMKEIIQGVSPQEKGVVDLNSAKDRYYFGLVDLRVKSDQKSTIYLHGYSGTLYKDNAWYTPEASYYQKNMDFLVAPYPFDIASLYHEQLRSEQKANMQTQQIEVRYDNAPKTYAYIPYYSTTSLASDAYESVVDSYVSLKQEEKNTYSYTTYIENQVFPEVVRNPYVEKYMDAVMFTNRIVPTKIEQALRKLSIPTMNIYGSNEEKIKAIQSFVQSFGTYTLTPGETPTNKDFITHFIENKQGYCVHYASLATMLLRSNNIPARYAQGYRIDPSDFIDEEALVKDYHAHAWVEIFDERFGWVPLEVTPASSQGSTSSNPAIPGQTPDTPSSNQNNNPSATTPNEVNPDVKDDGLQYESYTILLFPIAMCSLAILFIVVRRAYVIKKRERKIHQNNRKEAVLAVAKYITYFISDKDIPKDVREILEEARFSSHSIHEEQYIWIMKYQKLLRKQKFTSCTWLQKMKYIWWYCV